MSDYLALQALEARAAMDQTRRHLQEQAKELVDPRMWVDQYPWASMAALTALGFLTASAITPTRQESFKHRLQSLFPQVAAQPDSGEAIQEPRKKKGSMLRTLTGPLLSAAKTALLSSVSSAITAKVPQPTGAGWAQGAESQAGGGAAEYPVNAV